MFVIWLHHSPEPNPNWHRIASPEGTSKWLTGIYAICVCNMVNFPENTINSHQFVFEACQLLWVWIWIVSAFFMGCVYVMLCNSRVSYRAIRLYIHVLAQSYDDIYIYKRKFLPFKKKNDAVLAKCMAVNLDRHTRNTSGKSKASVK